MRRLDYEPDFPEDQLDLSWTEWRRLIGGTLAVIAFIVLVALAGSAL